MARISRSAAAAPPEFGDEAVPAAHPAVAGYQPLADRELLAVVRVRHPDLAKPPDQLGRRPDVIGKGLQPGPKRRIAGGLLAALPAPRAGGAKLGVGIVTEGRGERLLEARLRAERREHRRAAALQRSGQRLLLGLGRRMRGPRRRQRAFGLVASLGGRASPGFGGREAFLGAGQPGFSGGRADHGFVAGRLQPGPRIGGGQLLGELGALAFDPACLGLRRFERGFRHAPLGAHRRLPGEQVSECRFGLPRHGFHFAQLGCEPGGAALAVGQALLDCRSLAGQLLDRTSRIGLERLLAGNLRRGGGFQPLELGQPPGDGVASGAGGRQLVGKLAAAAARLGAGGAPLGEPRFGHALRIARPLGLGIELLDLGRGRGGLLPGLLGRLLGFQPAGVDQPRLDRTDLVGQLPVSFGRPRLPPKRRRAILLVAEQLAEAGEVGLGGAQFLLGVLAPHVQPGDPRRFLEHQPALGRLGGDYRADPALADRAPASGRRWRRRRTARRRPWRGRRGRRSDRPSRRRARSGG